jgi:hypothetical protein
MGGRRIAGRVGVALMLGGGCAARGADADGA